MTDTVFDETLPSLRPIQETVLFSENEKSELRRWATLLSTTVCKQGRFRLFDEEKHAFCCLGVYAVETAPAEEWAAVVSQELGLTTDLTHKLGLYHKLYNLHLHAYFVSMNDVWRMTFPEISTTILYLLVNNTLPSGMIDKIWRRESARNAVTQHFV